MGKNIAWTNEENDLVIAAYFEFLDRSSNEKINKNEFYRTVSAALGTRTDKDVMVKMQNVSYVLETMDHPIIEGLKPRGGGGADNAQGALHRQVNMAVKERRDAARGLHLRLVS